MAVTALSAEQVETFRSTLTGRVLQPATTATTTRGASTTG